MASILSFDSTTLSSAYHIAAMIKPLQKTNCPVGKVEWNTSVKKGKARRIPEFRTISGAKNKHYRCHAFPRRGIDGGCIP
jgi:hypothetical protein